MTVALPNFVDDIVRRGTVREEQAAGAVAAGVERIVDVERDRSLRGRPILDEGRSIKSAVEILSNSSVR